MRTVIKGIKEVKRLCGIAREEDGMPILIYKICRVKSDDVIQEVDFDLTIKDDVGTCFLVMGHSCSVKSLMVFDKTEGLQRVDVLDTSVDGDIKTIVVDKVTSTEEQKFNYQEIMAQYNKEFDEYYNNLMEQFDDDKPMQITIKSWLDGGLSRQEVVRELKDIDALIAEGVPEQRTLLGTLELGEVRVAKLYS